MFVSHRAALLVSAVAGLSITACAPASGDYEYWAKATFLMSISENWRFTFEERLTFGDEARRLDDHQTDSSFTYWGLADWLGVGLG
ncbi:MAG: hypothetical protein JW741_11770, partial [Sedimentisphaerales bacterium]|nr:hypothetical protein [Sedimentisphaerales bacterium]